MASSLQCAVNLRAFVPALETYETRYSEIYQENCDRIYSLAFWMTDNELAAEALSTNTFLRAFAASDQPSVEQIDGALLAEIRELAVVGVLTLTSPASSQARDIRGKMKRIHLEHAVVQLPVTERLIFLLHDVEGYEHRRISQLLGISEDESQVGLHQARLQVRNLIAAM